MAAAALCSKPEEGAAEAARATTKLLEQQLALLGTSVEGGNAVVGTCGVGGKPGAASNDGAR